MTQQADGHAAGTRFLGTELRLIQCLGTFSSGLAVEELVNALLKWLIVIVALWVTFIIALTVYLTFFPPPEGLEKSPAFLMLQATLSGAAPFWRFIAPILQIGLIVLIVIAAAERFGFTRVDSPWTAFSGLGVASNIQAFIAIAIIGGVVIAALWGLDGAGILKDLAFVVVGFYFGTRRRQSEIEDAVAAGTTAGVAAAQATTPAQRPSTETQAT